MRLNYLLACCVLIGGCQAAQEEQANATGAVQEAISTSTLDKHLSALASDEFQGRKPFTIGEVRTVEYLEAAFKDLGLQPGNGASYFQDVPLVELDVMPDQELTVRGTDEEVKLQLGTEFVAFTERVEEQVELMNSQMVFAGFGIVAPEYGWNDYKGLDVKGKTVIVLVNDPGFASGDSTLFKGETMTYYGRWTYKYEEAARQGAAGLFIIHDTAPAGYPWMVVKGGWTGASLYLDMTRGSFKPMVQGWLSRDAAIKLFDASDVDMKNFVEKARKKDFKAVPLGLECSISVKNKVQKDVSQNVIAKITGKSRPNEYVIYSAHWDHLGIGEPVDGDSIYNGAHDNASGVAALLAIAEAMAKGAKPDRSVVFLAVTAEEQGLLGAKHYAENPIYPIRHTVANINMDGLKHYGPMKDVTIIGYGQSELEDRLKRLAEAQGRYITADPEPAKGYFFRSDHFEFAKVGIPALFAYGSYEHMDPDKGTVYMKRKKAEYVENNYHRPGDEYDSAKWDLTGIQQDATLFYHLGLELANSSKWPKWKEGSEFKSIRELE